MNAFASGLGAVGLLVSAVAGAAEPSKADPNNEEIIGTLQNVVGTVLVKEGEVSMPAVEGQQVKARHSVLVTEGAKALLVFKDGCDMTLDDEELYDVPRHSPCYTMTWAGPAAAGVACGAAHASKSNNSRALAAVGLAAGAGLLGTAQGRETDFREFAAALESAEGDVLAKDEGTGEFTPIRPGTRLRADQEILVKKSSKALIRFDDGCTKDIQVGDDVDDDDQAGDRYKIPHNSPCFVNGTWWASAAAAAGLCVTVENPNDVSSP